jgi:hypothetical protein
LVRFGHGGYLSPFAQGLRWLVAEMCDHNSGLEPLAILFGWLLIPVFGPLIWLPGLIMQPSVGAAWMGDTFAKSMAIQAMRSEIENQNRKR